jgi:tricorn protease
MHCTWRDFILSALILPLLALSAFGQEETLLLRQPTVSAGHVAFVYAGDIWVADRDGGSPRRLTVNPGIESTPMLSPDGARIAFTGNYDGNVDVYTIPIVGGSPTRLTSHPGDDAVVGWTPDGKRILFSSTRASTTNRYSRLFTVSVEGGPAEPLPLPMAERAAFSPDASRIAYTPIRDAFQTWKRYRGGRTTPIWLFDLKTYDYVEIPHERATDTNPIWLGDRVYFLSDRNHTMNLFAYDTRAKKVSQVTRHTDFDVKSASAGGGVIIYEQAGRLHVLNPETGKLQTLKIRVAPDLPYTRPHYEKAPLAIRNADLSPTGVRAVFEARGDIFTVPAKKGDIRNLTETPGACERDPAWSPDGKWIAYLSDASGEYQLMLREQTGFEKPKIVSLGDATFYYTPRWSPDSQKILYTDKRLRLSYLRLDKKEPVLIDTDTYDHIQRSFDAVWSPDSRWIAYLKRLDSQLRAVFVYELATGKRHQVTDGLSDAESPCFSRDGLHLFFAASTNVGLNVGWQDMSSYERPMRKSLYAVVLNKEKPSPFAPESDEETVGAEAKKEAAPKSAEKAETKKKDASKEGKPKKGAEGKAAEETKPVEVRIDLENLDQRIVALPLPARNYSELQSAADGKLFYLVLSERTHQEASENPEGHSLYRFDMKERKEKPYMEKVRAYWISHDGKSLLYRGPLSTFGIVKTADEPKPGDGRLDLARMDIYVVPRAEWTQMFNEAWRIERDFFYAANMHGADWAAVREKYRPFLAHVGHRSDLNYLFAEMFGELVVGHAYVSGGDMPETERVAGGLLGADYEIAGGFYRFKRIYSGENWNPDLRAPLTEPGVKVAEGDYLLAVNGEPLKAPTDVFSLFEKTADRQTVLKVNSKPTLEGARTLTVVPIADESALRNRAWIEGNRRKVEELSKGRVAYVYMPNTAEAGYTYFNRYYFAQLEREAVVIDERFNGGGSLADYIIDMLSRPVLCYWATRDGKPFSTPGASLYGPKVMIVNEYAGSGGDAMPLFFRRRGLGPLVGKRTWGGLVGIYNYPALMDGGRVTAPRMAIFSPDGKWEVENEGVSPDVEVEMTPKLVIEGRDPQLEKAVEVVLNELKQHPVKRPPRPADPNRVK